ncbi:E3 ubiquitin-protein ligase RNF213 [Exaiptasia diaphana]|nr:E3 ubiquitin-protein ligase RNF213 [Exaiptasia diaphana]
MYITFTNFVKDFVLYGGDMQSFSRVLITRVQELLRKSDERRLEQGKKWSTKEAMEHSDLQETGTYRRALWRKIQNAIVPILSELITYIDTNGNLELLQENKPWLTELWLRLLQNNKITVIQYSSFLTEENEMIRSKVPVKSSGRDGHFFKCCLPFSWLIKEKVDVMWENAKGVSENSPNHESVEECLRVLMSNSDVSAIIDVINERQEAVERYIHDFVHMNYKPINGEIELVARAIIITTRQLHNRDGVNGDTTDFNFPDIALVHKAYSRIEHRLACFSHLVRCKPSVVPQLLKVISVDDIEMTLDVIALQICLESLEPQQVNMANTYDRNEWCEHVISVRAPTESMMVQEKDLENEEKTMFILTACRHLWERITAIRLFIEHVYSYKSSVHQIKVNPQNCQNIAQLCKALDEETDFSKAKYIEAVVLFLLECINSFTSKDKKFTLDPDVFDIFMRYITGSSSSQTKSFSPFPDFEVDETPVVRSFLLQQLLTTRNNDGVKKYIQRYLVDARELSSDEHHVIRVCQLTADCMEDSFAADMTEHTFELKWFMAVTKDIITSNGQKLTTNQDSENLDIEFLDAISKTRHGLGLTAEWLFKSRKTDDDRFEDMAGPLNEVLSVVEDFVKRLKHRAPLVYLLKQLARRYGEPVVRELIQQPDLQWLIPREFEGYQFMESAPDRFITHGDIYADVRDALGDGLMSGNFDRLLSIFEGHDNVLTNDVLCLMAVYREITCGYRKPRNKLPIQQELRKFLALPDHLSTQVHKLAAKLLDNSQGEGFSALSAQPNQPRATVDLAENSFLPTMPEDDFEKVRSGLAEDVTWYECPAGHRYSIGDCGRAYQESRCPECKSEIGGTRHRLLPGNKELAADRNVRPVSNLSFISKCAEKLVLQQLLSHCSENAPLPNNQSAYRKFHSTETCLLKVHNDILLSMDRREVTLLVLLDLSAAFYTIDHELLLDLLQSDFGVTDDALQLVRSLLSERQQRVVIGKSCSKDYQMKYGFPQGSCIDPILFLLYTSRLFKLMEKHLPDMQGYADDTQLYL